MNIKIDRMNLDDLKSIKDILSLEFDNFWNYNILKDELESKNSKYIVVKDIESNNEIVGFAGIKIFIDEADIMNIVVKKSYRNKGIGSLLLENLLLLCNKSNLKSLSLEVNEKNIPAINLYKSF